MSNLLGNPVPALKSASLTQDSGRVVVVTGAGCSTESNIPDYRGPNGAYNTGFKPMTHQQVGVELLMQGLSAARYDASAIRGQSS